MPSGDTFQFDNSYAAELKGFYVPWQGEAVPDPKIVQLNTELSAELGLDLEVLASPQGAAFFAGVVAPPGAEPLAQAYAGHQFGGFSPMLGDGRALLLGELIDGDGVRRDLQLKGSGRTPFSRGGDGKAVLGPVLREYLIGEAMHALGIPTTRALAAVTTGDSVFREGPQPGAVLARVAASHLRIGTFQFFSARQEIERVRQLADYSLRRHFPDLATDENPYLALLGAVSERQAVLVAKWLSVGFVHGVMNTDNMTISGETLDYGPCAFIDAYDTGAVFSSIDQHGRYAYGNQPAIAQWNLSRLAETLLPLINPDDSEDAVRMATEEIERFMPMYQAFWLADMRAKLGLSRAEDGDRGLTEDLLAVMQAQAVDFTGLFRALAQVLRGDTAVAHALFDDPTELAPWLERWLARLEREDADAELTASGMDGVNPIYIPRNHKVEEALQSAADSSDYEPFKKLLAVLENPFDQREGLEEYEGPAPESFGLYKTFCGT